MTFGFGKSAKNDFDSVSGGKAFKTGNKKDVNQSDRTYDQLRSQKITDKLRTRDVHNEQQLARGEIGEMRSPVIVEIGSAIIGIVVFLFAWFGWGLFGYFFTTMLSGGPSYDTELYEQLGVRPYYVAVEKEIGTSNQFTTCYQPLDEFGQFYGECGSRAPKEPVWYDDYVASVFTAHGIELPSTPDNTLMSWLFFGHIGLARPLVTFGGALAVWYFARMALMRQLETQNVAVDTTDINQHYNDARLMVPQEFVRELSLFPDVGAHSPVQPSSMISHVMLSNKGLNKVEVTQFADATIIDHDTGEIVHEKGEKLLDEHGNVVTKTLPMIDSEFSHGIFDKSDVPNLPEMRRFFSPAKIPWNPGGKNRDKYGDQDTLAQHINEEWKFPDYEPQRPAGAYVVDEAPVNTLVLAMTRAGKGQTYIEPMIDMWSRETRPNNMCINDPKGELLVKNYIRLSRRGYQVVQFNLINNLKTDIYNPLGLAAEAAREGDSMKCATYVENIAEVFFPVDGADDPVWPNAANNAFKRAAYGLIDYYLEEEREMRKQAAAEKWDAKVLDTRIDQMWGKVTLYNCYQLFVQLSAKKLKDPISRLNERAKNGDFGNLENEEDAQVFQEAVDEATENEAFLWEGEKEKDMLTLFFSATDGLPKSSIRTLVGNADKALKSMGGAEKMMASCD